jgi:hypothetical protein
MPEGLVQQFSLSMALCREIARAREALDQVRRLRKQVAERKAQAAAGPVAEALDAIERKAAALEGESRRFGAAGAGAGSSLARLIGQLASLYEIVQDVDAAPTLQAEAAARELGRSVDGALARWSELKEKDMDGLNESLTRAGLPVVVP